MTEMKNRFTEEEIYYAPVKINWKHMISPVLYRLRVSQWQEFTCHFHPIFFPASPEPSSIAWFDFDALRMIQWFEDRQREMDWSNSSTNNHVAKRDFDWFNIPARIAPCQKEVLDFSITEKQWARPVLPNIDQQASLCNFTVLKTENKNFFRKVTTYVIKENEGDDSSE